MKDFFLRHKEFIITGTVVLSALLFLGFFTESENLSPFLQSAIVSFAVFLVLPVLYCKIVMRRSLALIGWRKGSMFAGLIRSLMAVTSGLVFLFAIMHFTPLFAGARLPVAVERNFFIFVLYEVFLNGWITLLLEVFFRGFVMLFWLKRIGFLAVFIQAGIFLVLLFLSHGITPQTIPLLLFSPLAGLVAYQSGSILNSWAASWFFIFLSDAILLIVR